MQTARAKVQNGGRGVQGYAAGHLRPSVCIRGIAQPNLHHLRNLCNLRIGQGENRAAADSLAFAAVVS